MKRRALKVKKTRFRGPGVQWTGLTFAGVRGQWCAVADGHQLPGRVDKWTESCDQCKAMDVKRALHEPPENEQSPAGRQ